MKVWNHIEFLPLPDYDIAQRLCIGTAAVCRKLWPSSALTILLPPPPSTPDSGQWSASQPSCLALDEMPHYPSDRLADLKLLWMWWRNEKPPPCWDMNLDVRACSSYPMHYTDWGHHNMKQLARLVKAVRLLPLRDMGFPCTA
jgi:hypothetical protein